MTNYIPTDDFIRNYIRANARLRHNRLDVSLSLETPEPRDMIIESMDVYFFRKNPPHKIAGLDGKGLVLAGALADRRHYPLVVLSEELQLAGLEGDIITEEYKNENDKRRTVEVRRSSIWNGFTSGDAGNKPRILLIDDVLKHGKKMHAAIKAIRRAGGDIAGVCVVAAVEEGRGVELLESDGISVDYVVKISMEKLKKGDYAREEIPHTPESFDDVDFTEKPEDGDPKK